MAGAAGDQGLQSPLSPSVQTQWRSVHQNLCIRDARPQWERIQRRGRPQIHAPLEDFEIQISVQCCLVASYQQQRGICNTTHSPASNLHLQQCWACVADASSNGQIACRLPCSLNLLKQYCSFIPVFLFIAMCILYMYVVHYLFVLYTYIISCITYFYTYTYTYIYILYILMNI